MPHPAAPEFAQALTAHERWWAALWDAQEDAENAATTMTAEFGPDGYLHTLPFTGMPVANLDEVNRWMAARQRQHFAERHPASPLLPIEMNDSLLFEEHLPGGAMWSWIVRRHCTLRLTKH